MALHGTLAFFQAVLARNKARVLIEQDYVLSIYLSKHNILSTYDGDYILSLIHISEPTRPAA